MYMYHLAESKFKQLLHQGGYANISQFARIKKLNRATIHAYLSGQEIFSEQFLRIARALNADPADLIEPDSEHVNTEIPLEINKLIKQLVADKKYLCFMLIGSRNDGTSQTYSDWDIALASSKGILSSHRYLILKERSAQLSENLPWAIDLINMDNAPDWFLTDIKSKPSYLGGSRLAYNRFCQRWEHLREYNKTE